jgi:hypothetical protein
LIGPLLEATVISDSVMAPISKLSAQRLPVSIASHQLRNFVVRRRVRREHEPGVRHARSGVVRDSIR